MSRIAVALVLLLVSAASLGAQAPADWNSTGIQRSRAELQEMLARYQETEASSAYSEEFRSSARAEANLIRARLENGDFNVGDQVTIVVEGEEQLSGTFTVQTGPALVIPVVGTVALNGVLRSELESRLEEHFKKFVIEPRVHARSTIRILISGALARAGFFPLPAEVVVSDALMAAGGPTPLADLENVRIERDGKAIWGGGALKKALAEGRTLDELSIRAGDHLVVPEKRVAGFGSAVRNTLMVVSPILLAITTLVQVF